MFPEIIQCLIQYFHKKMRLKFHFLIMIFMIDRRMKLQ
jgi:hypothetical protein